MTNQVQLVSLPEPEPHVAPIPRSLDVYRMAFSQPSQDDPIAFLLSRMPLDHARTVADELRIDLTPSPCFADCDVL